MLLLAGTAGARWDVPVALAIAGLLESRNAAATLTALTVILGVLFLATNWLGAPHRGDPQRPGNVVAQIGRVVATGPLTPLFYLVQLSAAVVLLLAASTSFNGFPPLAAWPP